MNITELAGKIREYIDVAVENHEDAYVGTPSMINSELVRQVLSEYILTPDGRAKLAQSYRQPTELQINQAVGAVHSGTNLLAVGISALRYTQVLLHFMRVVPEVEWQDEHVKTLLSLMNELEDWGRQCLSEEEARRPERARLLNVLQSFASKPIRTHWQRILKDDED